MRDGDGANQRKLEEGRRQEGRRSARQNSAYRVVGTEAVSAPSRYQNRRAPGGGVMGAPPVLLAGGNPRIAKGEGNEPGAGHIAAIPGWKRDLGRRLDALIERAPFRRAQGGEMELALYGIEGDGWFLGIHCFTVHQGRFLSRGMSLSPVPPDGVPNKDTRYLNLREDEPFDEAVSRRG